MVAAALINTNAKVLVLIPPAVEPDPPPINIKKIKNNKAGVANAPIETVLNPAVLAVIL